MKKLVIILLLFSPFVGISQNYADKEYYLVDSLDLDALTDSDKELIEKSLKNYHIAKDDTSKIYALNSICKNMMHEDWVKYLFFRHNSIEKALNSSLSKKELQSLKFSLSNSFNSIGFFYYSQAQYSIALKYYISSFNLKKDIRDEKGIANSYTNIGSVYISRGQFDKGLEFYTKSLRIREKIIDKPGLINSYNNIGLLYESQNLFKEATEFYHKSIIICKEIGNKKELANTYLNIGVIYYKEEAYEEALDCLNKSLNLQIEIGHKDGIAISIGAIGDVYDKQNKFSKALEYYSKSYEIEKEIGDKLGEATTLNSISNTLIHQEKYDEALEYSIKSFELSKTIESIEPIRDASKNLSILYEKKGNYNQSLKMYKDYILLRDSINNEETQKAAIRQQTQYEFEKEQIRKENEAKEKARIKAAELQRRDNLEYSLIFLGILLLFGAVLMLGFIKVSPNIAEGLIFFSFLIFFEFVLVFVEPYLNDYTDGEPIYTLIANAGIALLIFPLHDKLETVLKKRIVKK